MINKNRSTIYLAPALTLVLGFMPMVFFSIAQNAFWIASPHNFPLLAVPSVLFGDSVLFPILNYRIQTTLTDILGKLQTNVIIRNLVLSFFFSCMIHSYSHYMWAQDSYSGFIDPTPGRLSIAGWWHLGFSIIQSSIIFWFAGMWIMIAKQQDRNRFRFFRNTWLYFVAFTILNISGSIAQEIIIIQNRSLWLLLKDISWNFLPLFFSLAILGIANYLNKMTFRMSETEK